MVQAEPITNSLPQLKFLVGNDNIVTSGKKNKLKTLIVFATVFSQLFRIKKASKKQRKISN